MLALFYRRRSGTGQHVAASQQEGLLQRIAPAYMDYVLNGRVAGPMGNRHPLGAAAPHGVFPCAGEDRWISIAVLSDDEWKALAEAMGTPDWSVAFDDHDKRLRNIEALHDKLAAWTEGQDDYQLAERLQRAGVAAAPVLRVADLRADPNNKARGNFLEVEHPLGFHETIYGSYVKTSGPAPRIEPGPTIGRDNDHVFRSLMGIPEARYRRLIEQEVIF